MFGLEAYFFRRMAPFHSVMLAHPVVLLASQAWAPFHVVFPLVLILSRQVLFPFLMLVYILVLVQSLVLIHLQVLIHSLTVMAQVVVTISQVQICVAQGFSRLANSIIAGFGSRRSSSQADSCNEVS
jgi:hypothetical protein